MARKPKAVAPLDRARVRREAADIASLLEELQRRARAARLEAQRSREYAAAREHSRATGLFPASLVTRWVGAVADLEDGAGLVAQDYRAVSAGKRPPHRPNAVL